MIVVLSYDDFEQGTEPVIDWLINLGASFVKVTIKDIFKNDSEIRVDVNAKRLFFKSVDITDEINVFFYRRLFSKFTLEAKPGTVFKEQLEHEITDESFALINYLFYMFRDKVWLPVPERVNVNKLVMLNKASESGLIVPRSVVLNNKSDLRHFYEQCGGAVVTKPIHKAGYYIIGKYTYFSYVNKLDDLFIDNLPEIFFPSLFQECVEKDYEIRVFYLDGEFYCVALLMSGKAEDVDVKLSTQTRNANWVPYNLPAAEQEKLTSFFKSINLNTGSVDVVRTRDGCYVFLEVNPVGQYGAPSHQGNFYLEKRIAEYLIEKDQVYEKQY